jgi:hypothetical protein
MAHLSCTKILYVLYLYGRGGEVAPREKIKKEPRKKKKLKKKMERNRQSYSYPDRGLERSAQISLPPPKEENPLVRVSHLGCGQLSLEE